MFGCSSTAYDVSKSVSLGSFGDAGKVESWAKKPMQWTAAEGLIVGIGRNLVPNGTATRAQVATILYRYMNDYLPGLHEHEYTESVVAPSCTKKGYIKHTCTICGSYYNDSYVDKTEHDMNYQIVVSPTCMKQGYAAYVCDNCDYTTGIDYLDVIPHDYEVTVVAPTCTAQGYTLYSCINCTNYYRDNYQPLVDHDYTEQVVAPTCTAQGYTIHTCGKCGRSYKDDYVPMAEHDKRSTVVAPTCTARGYTLYYCIKCSYSYRSNYTDMVEHNYVGGACTRCGGVEPSATAISRLKSWLRSNGSYSNGSYIDVWYIDTVSYSALALYLDSNGDLYIFLLTDAFSTSSPSDDFLSMYDLADKEFYASGSNIGVDAKYYYSVTPSLITKSTDFTIGGRYYGSAGTESSFVSLCDSSFHLLLKKLDTYLDNNNVGVDLGDLGFTNY